MNTRRFTVLVSLGTSNTGPKAQRRRLLIRHALQSAFVLYPYQAETTFTLIVSKFITLFFSFRFPLLCLLPLLFSFFFFFNGVL